MPSTPECRFCHNTDPIDLVTDMTAGWTYCHPWCGLAKTIPSSSELEEA